VQELLQEGIAQVQAGNAPAGFALLRQVVDESPDDADAWLWLGWAAASQNQRDLAEKCFLRAQQLGAQQATQALEWLRKR
jgi:Flp pilus assembly protein TadD